MDMDTRDMRADMLQVAVDTIKKAQGVGLTMPCTTIDLCKALNYCGFPNFIEYRTMSGSLSGVIKRDPESEEYGIILDAAATAEQQERDLGHEISHMVNTHALTGLRCQRMGLAYISDLRELEAENGADWFVVLVRKTARELAAHDRSEFRHLVETINRDKRPRLWLPGRRWR